MGKRLRAIMPKLETPYSIVDEIAYDSAARDLSVENAKAKATGAEALHGQTALEPDGNFKHGAGTERE
jgi:branched-chain amino acid transport system substrate-binding protein